MPLKLWEAHYGPDETKISPGAPTRGEREVASREEAVLQFPIGTIVDRPFCGQRGHSEDLPPQGMRLQQQSVPESGVPGWGLGGAYAKRAHSRDGATVATQRAGGVHRGCPVSVGKKNTYEYKIDSAKEEGDGIRDAGLVSTVQDQHWRISEPPFHPPSSRYNIVCGVTRKGDPK